ncbi:MAG: sigma-70 family RNA polymerase sigma factor [Kiritimatiellae bacterium]|nr:sigma-70 family RNA polymerase sigma factor [Kiritimatiellia bacterium]
MNKKKLDPSNIKNNETEIDDRHLVERAKQGDEEAFGDLVKVYHQRVYNLTYRYVNNAQDAQELVQQTWIKVWNKLHTFKGNAKFYTWVYRIAGFVCLDYIRKRSRQKEVELLSEFELPVASGAQIPASIQSRPDRQAERAEVKSRFYDVLESLSPEHKMTLILREVEGLSYVEIAKMMKRRKGTVMSRIFYARKIIQEKLKELR